MISVAGNLAANGGGGGTGDDMGMGDSVIWNIVTSTAPTIPIVVQRGSEIRTIEGLSANGLTPVQEAWIEHQVPQCGYCQSGMIMAVSALLQKNPSPTDQQLSDAVTNICRWGTYPRIRAAVRALATVRG